MDPGVVDISYLPTESFPNILSHATFGTMTLPSGPTEFGSCLEKTGLPPILCPTVWQIFHQSQPPLLLGGFPMNHEQLSPCLNQDLGNSCPVTEKTGRSFVLREDLYDKSVCMYDDCAAIMVAEPPPPHVATTPVPPPVPSRLACVPIQPWPPPVFLVFAQPLSQESTAPCLKASRGGGR